MHEEKSLYEELVKHAWDIIKIVVAIVLGLNLS